MEQNITVERKQIELELIKNNSKQIFIDIENWMQCSLASLRGKPPTYA